MSESRLPATETLPETAGTGKAAAQQMTVGTRGFQIANLEEAYRLAQFIAKSTLCPSSFRNKPEDVLVSMQWSMELGVSILQALQNIAVINGRASIWGDLVPALVLNSGLCEYINERDPQEAAATGEARCEMKRRGWPEPTVRTFTTEMAQAAGLLNKDTYKQYLGRMLQMRARAFCARDAFPDVLRGFVLREEAEDMPPESTEPRDITPKATDEGERKPTRRRNPPRIEAKEEEVPKQPADAPAAANDAPTPADETEPEGPAQPTLSGTEEDGSGEGGKSATAEADGYKPPAEPTKPNDILTRAVSIYRRTLYTAGISGITLLKVRNLADQFDKLMNYSGAWEDALNTCFDSAENSPPDYYHLSEEQGRQFSEYLAAELKRQAE